MLKHKDLLRFKDKNPQFRCTLQNTPSITHCLHLKFHNFFVPRYVKFLIKNSYSSTFCPSLITFYTFIWLISTVYEFYMHHFVYQVEKFPRSINCRSFHDIPVREIYPINNNGLEYCRTPQRINFT